MNPKVKVRRDAFGWWSVGAYVPGIRSMFVPGTFAFALAYALRASGASPNPQNLDPWGRLPDGSPTQLSRDYDRAASAYQAEILS